MNATIVRYNYREPTITTTNLQIGKGSVLSCDALTDSVPCQDLA